MKKTAKAYHINAVEKTITEVEVEHSLSLRQMQFYVGGLIETAVHLQKDDVIFVNEEGLLCGPEHFFQVFFNNELLSFAGDGIVIGTDDAGNNDDVKMPLEELKKKVIFVDRETILQMYEGLK